MISEPLSTDLGVLAEMYEEFHLLRCRTDPHVYCPPFEDSYYFNELSNILLYSNDEMIICVDEETDFIKGFAVFGIREFSSPILRKRIVCKIDLILVRRGSEDSGADSEMVEYIKTYAAQNGCSSIEYAVPADDTTFCDNSGFEPLGINMEIKLK